jgi:hypothetical protein
MVLTYTVELNTGQSFTSRINVDSESKAEFNVNQFKKINKKKGYNMYYSFKLYDQLNVVNRKPVLLRSW